MQWEGGGWDGRRGDRLRTGRRPGVWHSGGLESDGIIGGRGMGVDGHGGWAEVHGRVGETRGRRG